MKYNRTQPVLNQSWIWICQTNFPHSISRIPDASACSYRPWLNIATSLDYLPYAVFTATFTPCKLLGPIRMMALYGRSSRGSRVRNRCTKRRSTYDASVSTSTCAGQMRGPPPKGTNFHRGRTSPQRSGRKTSASGPQLSGSRCMRYRLAWTMSPFWMKMGWL